jgi:very-long-chain enoyl-CoA reductase
MPLKIAKLPTNILAVKNLGKQIRWEMVFYIEYLGPILILPLFYLLGKKESYTNVQTVGLVLGVLHYLKREYETAFVHVFSRESMPFKRVLINSFHYWVLFALFNSIELFFFPSGNANSQNTTYILVGLWAIFEFLNYKCHKVLGDFRRSPKAKSDKEYSNASKERQIPYGYGFGLVSCANYFWEGLGWLTYSLLTKNYTAYIFTVFSVVQMAIWALDKHRRYRKDFGDKYPRGRKAMFPFIL